MLQYSYPYEKKLQPQNQRLTNPFPPPLKKKGMFNSKENK